ncbi:TPA: hypothetical protein SIF59_004288 [Escherichia coli]|nr:hypothetical protein [Escherichia coli]
MQLKNNTPANVQLYFTVKKNGRDEVDFIHIPGKATVEIDDKIFKQLTTSKTEVRVKREEVQEIETENPVTMDKRKLTVKEYYDTGETKVVNLMLERIKAGEFTVVERVAISEKEMDAVLVANNIKIEGMTPEQKVALYDKLV